MNVMNVLMMNDVSISGMTTVALLPSATIMQ
jgi:hypothetical protein